MGYKEVGYWVPRNDGMDGKSCFDLVVIRWVYD